MSAPMLRARTKRPGRAGSWRLAVAAVAAAGMVVAGTVVTASAQAAELPVVGVTASSHDGNVPANAIDGNLTTRWSAEGDGQWIQFDLGSVRHVKSVAIAWAKGNERKAFFDVQASVDGNTWTTVLGGAESNGTTLNLQCHIVWPTDPRYVRIVGHGNNDPNIPSRGWNSITEAEIYDTGNCDSTPPTSPPPTTPAGAVPVKAACKNSGTLNNGTFARTGFPTDATTGPEVAGLNEDVMVPSGVSGNWNITQNGFVIDGKYHNGLITVNASNVTIRNSVICGTGTHIILNNGTNLVIENSIIRGERGTVTNPNTGEPCQSNVAFGNYIVRRSEFTNCADGVKISGSVEIHNSWFHDNYANRFGGGAGTHNDTVHQTGSTTTRFVFNGNAAYQDSCTSNRHIWLASTHSQTGPINFLRVQNNFFYGIKVAALDRETRAADGVISGNTIAGTAQRGPFSKPMWSGAGMGTVSRTGNVYESGQPANDNPSSSYVCVGG